jgi:uncharacterized membrane protein YozB (DUF420 family)
VARGPRLLSFKLRDQPRRVMSGKIPRHTLTVVGVTTVVLAMLGLWYNYSTLFLDYSLPLEQSGKEHALQNFYPIFYRMSVICIVFYLILLASGVQLIRKKTGWVFVLLGVVVMEVLYFLFVGYLWAHSPSGFSVAAATGVSTGGLSYQVYVGFPVWGPLLALWARRRILTTGDQN